MYSTPRTDSAATVEKRNPDRRRIENAFNQQGTVKDQIFAICIYANPTYIIYIYNSNLRSSES